MTAKISVITACYNHGIYLDDAIKSLQNDKYLNVFEHIIVDDGSRDVFTLEKLTELEKNGSIVIRQSNQGLGSARNAGIKVAKGEYIIPLDCDNKLNPEIILEAARILDYDKSISVVYTDAEFFGLKKGRWIVGPFDILRLMNQNYIDACALFRKTTWESIGGYDINMPSMGHEDWDLWLNIYYNNENFFYLKKIGFYYRISGESMSSTFSLEKNDKIRTYLFNKYSNFIPKNYNALIQLAYPENLSGYQMIKVWLFLFFKIMKRIHRYIGKAFNRVTMNFNFSIKYRIYL